MNIAYQIKMLNSYINLNLNPVLLLMCKSKFVHCKKNDKNVIIPFYFQKANTCNNFAYNKYLMDPTVKFVNRAYRDSHSIKSFCNRPLMSNVIKRRYLSHSHHNVLRQSQFGHAKYEIISKFRYFNAIFVMSYHHVNFKQNFSNHFQRQEL